MSGKRRALQRLCANDVALRAVRAVLLEHGHREASELAALEAMRPPKDVVESLVVLVQQLGKDAGHEWMQDADSCDGWPGLKFYTTLWLLYEIGPDKVCERAKEVADGKDAIYLMDAQTSRAFEDVWDRDGDGGDCSDFVAYCFMRAKSGMHDWKNSRGQRMWVECSNICSMLDKGDGWLVEVQLDDVLGDGLPFVAVYPDYKKDGKRRQGHIAIINGITKDGDLLGWDCSSSQGRKGDAIRYRDLSFFRRKPETRYARPSWWIADKDKA